MVRTDIIVSDEEFLQQADALCRQCRNSEEMLESMLSTLNAVTLNIEGNIAVNFKSLVNEISGLKGGFEQISREGAALIKQFLKEIDEADSWLY